MTTLPHAVLGRGRAGRALLAGLLALLAGMAACAPPELTVKLVKQTPTDDRAVDGVILGMDHLGTSLTIWHRHGIGHATLVLVGREWPARLRLAFRDFPALEGCTVDAVDAAGKSLWPAETGELRPQPRPEGKPGEPFTVIIPPPPAGTRELRIHWVDHYRN